MAGFTSTLASAATVLLGYTVGIKFLNGTLDQLISEATTAAGILDGVVNFSTDIGVINLFLMKFFLFPSMQFLMVSAIIAVALVTYSFVFVKHCFRQNPPQIYLILLFTPPCLFNNTHKSAITRLSSRIVGTSHASVTVDPQINAPSRIINLVSTIFCNGVFFG